MDDVKIITSIMTIQISNMSKPNFFMLRDKEGDYMDRDYTYLGVNDFLDLYLLARKLGDDSWQNELMEKMLSIRKEEIIRENPEMSINRLWNKYKMINTQILDLYSKLRNNKSDQEIYHEIKELKKQRMEISRKIYAVERRTQN